LAGTSVDLLFFPIDTVKTRLQSAQGFAKAGGFRGIYKGVGSVIVGSAPSGLYPLSLLFAPEGFTGFPLLAAIFFVTYDTLKQTLPTPPHLAPVNHMLSASIGEVVRFRARSMTGA
jgi:solute carrier family 25 S-adenosylmethionine transporter 26